MKLGPAHERILGALEERDGVGVTVAVIASELGYKRSFVAEQIRCLYKTAPFRIVLLSDGNRHAYRWKEGKQRERVCACGHPWWQHEGRPGTECIADRCNCGIFTEDTN